VSAADPRSGALRTANAAYPLRALQLVIVDQQRTFRDALVTRLRIEHDLAVVAQAQSAESVRPALVGRSADVILLDAELPGDTGLAFCAEATRRAHPPRVVMLSAASDAGRIIAAIRAGAASWVGKDESIDHLLCVIRGVVRGETWLPSAELGAVLRLLIKDQDDRRGCDDLLATLTPREWDVLAQLVEGAGRREVAERLQLSANTVRTHLQSLMAKLGAHSTLEVVALTRPRLEARQRSAGCAGQLRQLGMGELDPAATGLFP
jgi:DNA-binding NarL/FixJ family response regulator